MDELAGVENDQVLVDVLTKNDLAAKEFEDKIETALQETEKDIRCRVLREVEEGRQKVVHDIEVQLCFQ